MLDVGNGIDQDESLIPCGIFRLVFSQRLVDSDVVSID